MEQENFMREALKEAAIARDQRDWAIGCVITLDNKIVARGRNGVFSTQHRLLHAEIDAINKLQPTHFDSKGKNFTLYTTLEPCPMCFGAILLSGIRTVIAGTNIDNSGASAYIEHLPGFFKHPRFATTLITGILEQECAEMWFSGTRAKRLFEKGIEITSPPNKEIPSMYSSHEIVQGIILS